MGYLKIQWLRDLTGMILEGRIVSFRVIGEDTWYELLPENHNFDFNIYEYKVENIDYGDPVARSKMKARREAIKEKIEVEKHRKNNRL